MGTIKKKLLDFGAMEIKCHDGTEWWKPREHAKSINLDDLEILQKYNYTIRGFHSHQKIHAGKIDRPFNGEPDTLKGVSPVRRRVFGNLPRKRGKAPDA